MTLTLFAGRGNGALAAAIAAELGIAPGPCRLEYFPDGEIEVELGQEVEGHDVYLIQPTSPPVADHLLQLLLLADAILRLHVGARGGGDNLIGGKDDDT